MATFKPARVLAACEATEHAPEASEEKLRQGERAETMGSRNLAQQTPGQGPARRAALAPGLGLTETQRNAKAEAENMPSKAVHLRLCVFLWTGRGDPPEGEARRAALALTLGRGGGRRGTGAENDGDDIDDTGEDYR